MLVRKSERSAKYCADRSDSLEFRDVVCGRSNFHHANSRLVVLPGCRVTNHQGVSSC
jgi:hypothetical protein